MINTKCKNSRTQNQIIVLLETLDSFFKSLSRMLSIMPARYAAYVRVRRGVYYQRNLKFIIHIAA